MSKKKYQNAIVAKILIGSVFEKSTCPESSDNEGSDGQRGADPDGGHHLVHEVGDDEGARASTGCREQKNITWGNLNYKLYYSTILATVKLITICRTQM